MPILDKLRTHVIEYKRVWRVTKKPSKEEFKAIVKVTSIGIAIIGLLGFLIGIIAKLAK
jgi:protein transport protein SEC61 subunit gamma-like protein